MNVRSVRNVRCDQMVADSVWTTGKLPETQEGAETKHLGISKRHELNFVTPCDVSLCQWPAWSTGEPVLLHRSG